MKHFREKPAVAKSHAKQWKTDIYIYIYRERERERERENESLILYALSSLSYNNIRNI